MRLKRAIRMFFVAAVLAAPVACGIDLLATGDGSVTDASPDGQATTAPDGSSDADEENTQYTIAPTPDPLEDAGLDVNNANCLALCPEAGVASCDAGWCVFDCSGKGSCSDDPVVCPPGIPCEVNCAGESSCGDSVDCTAGSACRIHCTGDTSCASGEVNCAGAGCQLDCNGQHACHDGAGCDASACVINCLGDDSCNHYTQCTGDSCSIRCGTLGVTYAKGNNTGPCAHKVDCETTTLCDIACAGDETCRQEVLTAQSAGRSIVQCAGKDTCNHGLHVGGAEAGVVCTGQGDTCNGDIWCDAGACNMACENSGTDLNVCCKAPNPGTNCRKTTSNCSIDFNDKYCAP